MNRLARVVLTLFFLAPWPAFAQESTPNTVSLLGAAAAYPNTATGLQQFLSDVMNAARDGDKRRVARFIREMEVPNHEVLHDKTDNNDKAASRIIPYKQDRHQNNKALQQLLSSLAHEDGAVQVRKVNDSPASGHGGEWGIANALGQPVDVYYASWQLPGAKASRPVPIGYFMYVDAGFRWDGGALFGAISLPVGDRNARVQSSPVSEAADAQVYKVGGGVSAPRVLSAPDPEYTPEARKAKLVGTVVLWVIIGRDGRPQDVRVQKSLGMGLDEKAIESMREWRFRPALKDGKAVAVEINVNMNFHL